MTCVDLDRDLDAYVDHELDAGADEAMRIHVQSCVRCADRAAERLALKRLVQAAPYYQAPSSLHAAVARQAARRDGLRRILVAAAAVVLLAAGSATVVTVTTQLARADATRLVDAHVRALTASHVFDVRSTDQHTVKPWFAGKLDYSPPVSDLAPMGFPLVGGRIDRLDGRAVAVLVYQHRLHVIDVFVAPAGRQWWPRATTSVVRGYQVRHWTDHDMWFWAVSDLNDAELAQFARALGE